MRAVHRVRPHASRGDCERAVVVAARNVRLRCKQVGRAVHIVGRQRACNRLRRIRLSQGRRAGARYHRCIVGARDGDRHQLRRAIS